MTGNQIEYQKYLETRRSNQARETETNRSNLANEAQKLKELQEQRRHNIVAESETARHNLSSEDVAFGTLQSNRELGYANLAESQRSNLARELENTRHNYASEEAQIYTADQRLEGSRVSADVAKQRIAADKGLTYYKEEQANKRTRAQLEVEKAKTASGVLSNIANSIVKLLPMR